MNEYQRKIVWFSCGAPSAVAAKLALDYYQRKDVWVVYENLFASEHPDNIRFLCDIKRWLNYPIVIIRAQKFISIDKVFERTRYMSGIHGARCTVEMKKIPRFNFQEPDDIHIFGLAADELNRINDFHYDNPELNLDWILARNGNTQDDCQAIISNAGIDLPIMYKLGFANNNCRGCVKASSPAYWAKTRYFFPEVFKRRAEQSRAIGCKLVRIEGKRYFLDELPDKDFGGIEEKIKCGPQCSR